jgi:hypothetical protein
MTAASICVADTGISRLLALQCLGDPQEPVLPAVQSGAPGTSVGGTRPPYRHSDMASRITSLRAIDAARSSHVPNWPPLRGIALMNSVSQIPLRQSDRTNSPQRLAILPSRAHCTAITATWTTAGPPRSWAFGRLVLADRLAARVQPPRVRTRARPTRRARSGPTPGGVRAARAHVPPLTSGTPPATPQPGRDSTAIAP